MQTKPSIFPLSVTQYGLLFVLLGLLLFGGFSWISIKQISQLERAANQNTLQLTRSELNSTYERFIDSINHLGKQFSDWDETVQQYGNSTYYAYWRQYRVPASGFVPDYLVGVELYDIQGKPLAKPADADFPAQLSNTPEKYQLKKGKYDFYFLLTYPLLHNIQNPGLGGYIVLKLDFIAAFKKLQRFRYGNLNTITIDFGDANTIKGADIVSRIHADPIANAEFKQLQSLMYKTLGQFFTTGMAMALLLLYLLVKIFALPSRHLSHHIDSLHQGYVDPDSDHETSKLSVAEFEKIRRSLNHYQAQINQQDAQLRENEMRMRTILDNVVDGILTIDEKGCIESCNMAGGIIFSESPELLVGKNISSLIESETLQDYFTYYGQRFHKLDDAMQSNDTCELLGIKSDHSIFPMEIALSKIEMSGRQLYVVVVRDITERKRAEEKLLYMANFDELTGLPNRTLFRDRLTQAVAHARLEKNMAAVIFFDLDQFKKVNDSAGHHVGDQLLIGAAARLRKSVREIDTVSRFGGDEFMVILESIHNVDEVTDLVERMLLEMEKPFQLDQQEVFVGASAGIALYPIDDTNIDNLLKNADTAMFRAKEIGGNSYQYFQAEMNSKAVERLKLESALRYALEKNQFELYYQPRINVKQDRVIGMEALLRWNHPELGTVSPLHFIPILEETGLIMAVGDWVLETACRHTKIWHEAGFTDLSVSVNLSTRQFRQKDLDVRMRDIWEKCDFDPHYLELEITESVLMENMESAIDILTSFHDMGVRISIDDFGTGYSSLSYLKRFPIDTLKIDRSFVRDIIADIDDAVITEGIIALARSLQLQVVAEGVENQDQLRFLKALQCDEVQGFHFSRPLPLQEFEQYISDKAYCQPNTSSKLAGS